MALVNPWIQVADDLDLAYANEYLYAQAYNDSSGNIMNCLIPPQSFTDKFGNTYNTADVMFGTKVLNIFIAQATYGWTPTSDGTQAQFSWGDPGSAYTQAVNASLAYWPPLYRLFASYKTLIWTDFYTPMLLAAECPYMGSQMTQTDKSIQALCVGCPGFTYMGKITTQVPASFFQPYIDDFYGIPPGPLYRNLG